MLQNSTFQFLKALAKNNNREWFALHKPTYEIAKLDVIAFAEKTNTLTKEDFKHFVPLFEKIAEIIGFQLPNVEFND